jgi:intein/homing endonuclease
MVTNKGFDYPAFRLSSNFVIDTSDERVLMQGLRIAVIGESGSGKSWTMALIAEQAIVQGLQVMIIDPHGEYWTFAEKFPGVVVIGGGNADLPLDEDAIDVYAEAYRQGKILDFNLKEIFTDEEAYGRMVEKILRQLWKVQVNEARPAIWLMEEAHLECPQEKGADVMRRVGLIKGIATGGRKFGVLLILGTQRPAELHKCCAGNTPVLLEKLGLRRISGLVKGAELLKSDETGDWMRLKAPIRVQSLNINGQRGFNRYFNMKTVEMIYRQKVEQTIEITTRAGRYFRVTTNQPFWCLDKGIKEKRAEELSSKDYLLIPRFLPTFDARIVPNQFVREWPKKWPRKQIDLPVSISPELGEFLGLFLSEGSLDDNDISFTNSLATLRERFQFLLRNLFGLESSNPGQGNRTPDVRVASSRLAAFLRTMGAVTSKGKTVPDLIMTAQRDVIEAFIKAYIQGDGHVREDGNIVICTKRLAMARRLCYLMQMLGFLVTKDKGADAYYIRTIKGRRYEKLSLGKKVRRQFYGDKIKEVKRNMNPCYVYDLVDCGNFIGGSLPTPIHNTPLSQCWLRVFGKLTEKLDRDAVKDYMRPLNPDALKSLVTGEFYVYGWGSEPFKTTITSKRLTRHGAETPLIAPIERVEIAERASIDELRKMVEDRLKQKTEERSEIAVLKGKLTASEKTINQLREKSNIADVLKEAYAGLSSGAGAGAVPPETLARIKELEGLERQLQGIEAELKEAKEQNAVLEAQVLELSGMKEGVSAIRRGFQLLGIGNGAAAARVDTHRIVEEVMKKMPAPVHTGKVVLEAKEYILKDYQRQEVDRIMAAVSKLTNEQKDLLRFVSGVGRVDRREAARAVFSHSTKSFSNRSWADTWNKDRLFPLVDIGAVRWDSSHSAIVYILPETIKRKLEVYKPTAAEIDQVVATVATIFAREKVAK